MKIAVIGAGAMGGSTVKGLIATGQEKAQDITVSDPSEKVLQQFAQMGTSVKFGRRDGCRCGDGVREALVGGACVERYQGLNGL